MSCFAIVACCAHPHIARAVADPRLSSALFDEKKISHLNIVSPTRSRAARWKEKARVCAHVPLCTRFTIIIIFSPNNNAFWGYDTVNNGDKGQQNRGTLKINFQYTFILDFFLHNSERNLCAIFRQLLREISFK